MAASICMGPITAESSRMLGGNISGYINLTGVLTRLEGCVHEEVGNDLEQPH